MKEIFFESLIFMLPIWSSLAFIAFKRHNKFKKITNYILILALVIVVVSSVWDFSAMSYGVLIYEKFPDKVSYFDFPYEEHSFGYYYGVILPMATYIFSMILLSVSEPDPDNEKE